MDLPHYHLYTLAVWPINLTYCCFDHLDKCPGAPERDPPPAVRLHRPPRRGRRVRPNATAWGRRSASPKPTRSGLGARSHLGLGIPLEPLARRGYRAALPRLLYCRPAGDETFSYSWGRRSFALARRGFIPSAARGKTDRYRRTAPCAPVLFFVFCGGVHACCSAAEVPVL
jgi:hypothetical protein